MRVGTSDALVDESKMVLTSPSSSSCSSPENGKEANLNKSSAPGHERKCNSMDASGVLFSVLLTVWTLSVMWQLLEGKTNLWPVVGGFCFFEVVGRIFSAVVAKPSILPGLQPRLVNSFINTSVSLLHSALVSVAVTIVLLHTAGKTNSRKMWTHEVLTKEAWPGAFVVLGASCGYSAYDQWDMLRRRLYKPRFPDILAHHAVLLTCFIFALCKNSCINYLILTLICEFHSIFLHLRKVLLLGGFSRKWSVLILVEWTLNWITFLSTRIVVHGLITLKLLLDFKKFEIGVELPLALMGMTGLNTLNLILGRGLYRACMREISGSCSTGKEAGD